MLIKSKINAEQFNCHENISNKNKQKKTSKNNF